MARSIVRSIIGVALALVAWLGDGSTAQAQYGYYNNYNYNYQPAYPTPFHFYSYQYYSLGVVSNTGVPYQVYQYQSNYGPYPTLSPFNNYSAYSNPGSYSSPGSMSGGYGASYEATTPEFARQRSALKSAQDSVKYKTATDTGTKNDLEMWLSDQSTRRDANNPKQPAVDIGLINPNDEQLLSGLSLNELSARILGLEAKGKKAAAGLCPPELVDKIAFVGGPSAEALNMFHAAKLNYPEILNLPDFDMLVEAFDKAYAPVVATLHAGKKVPVADLERLQTVIDKGKPITEPMLKSAPIRDAKALLAFYAALETGLKYLKLPESLGIIGGKWNTIGVNVSELVKHLHKYQIRFGRATAGDDAAYGSLHRGLLAYYAALSQAK